MEGQLWTSEANGIRRKAREEDGKYLLAARKGRHRKGKMSRASFVRAKRGERRRLEKERRGGRGRRMHQ